MLPVVKLNFGHQAARIGKPEAPRNAPTAGTVTRERFGDGVADLYFTAGPNGEAHGLFGVLQKDTEADNDDQGQRH
jgi:hypothetical protein